MIRGDDVAQSLGLIEPKWGRPAGQVLALFQFSLCYHVKEGQCTGYLMPKVGGGWVGWLADHIYGCVAWVWWVTVSNQWWSSPTPINTPHTPFGKIEIRKWDLTFYSAPKFILYRVERERRSSEGQRTSRFIRSPPTSSRVEALLESVWVW
jgi:hypothetical protein